MPQKKNKKNEMKKQVFLSARDDEKTNSPFNLGASVHASSTGSLTLEATLILPVFVMILFYFLFYFQVMLMEIQVEQALQYTSRTMAVYAETKTDGEKTKKQKETLTKDGIMMNSTVAKGMVIAQLKKKGANTKYVKYGILGFDFSKSDLSGDYVDLIVNYKMQIPFFFFRNVKTIGVQQRAFVRKWTGDSGVTKEEKKKVFITPTGTAYHTSKNCRYLDLSIQMVQMQNVVKKRNKSGGKYYACTSCCKGKVKSGNVYITDYGTEYHKNRTCRKLKRTVMEVLLEQVGNRKPCSKCGRN